MKSIFYTIIFLIIVTPAFAQATKETLYLKDQISRLEGEVSEQKNLIKGLTDEISMLTENQTILITNIKETNKFILGLPGSSELKNSQNKFKDAYRAWQLCTALNFGPSDQENLKQKVIQK